MESEQNGAQGWRVDTEGYLRTALGCKVARVTPAGMPTMVKVTLVELAGVVLGY